MTPRFDLLITGARVVDPASGADAIRDVSVTGPEIAAVEPELDPGRAAQVIDGRGLVLLPGVIDPHVHIYRRDAPRTHGHRALARAGVTTAVEFSAMRGVLDQWATSAAGLTILGIQALPSYTGATDPARIRDDVAASVRDGCIGVKIFGGHFPSTPEASARIIHEASELGCYVGFHAGTTAHGSDLAGMREALELADGNPMHLAHTPAYVRGLVADPMDENVEALRLLREHPRVVSEGHLGPMNGCTGGIVDGVPADHIARNCLRLRGYPITEAGLRQAFLDGYAHVNSYRDDGMVQHSGEAALREWEAAPARTRLSFPVNLRLSAYLQTCGRVDAHAAIAFEGPGEFIVDAISSDGGNWRNVILDVGLDLVRFGALSMLQLAHKTSARPAAMFGLKGKGRIAAGADADLVLVDIARKVPVLTVASGAVVFDGERVTGTGGVILTMSEGAPALRERGLPHRVIDLRSSLFCTKGRADSVATA
jgi:dihydroorotase-like cyclic amidohydrolase